MNPNMIDDTGLHPMTDEQYAQYLSDAEKLKTEPSIEERTAALESAMLAMMGGGN